MFHIATVILLTLTVICGSHGMGWFSRDGVCVASAPCTCHPNEVLCRGLQLRAMPTFIPRDVSNESEAGGHMSNAFFQMYSNNIEVINDRAFCNLTFALSTSVHFSAIQRHLIHGRQRLRLYSEQRPLPRSSK
ncbi:hypothetical protein DPMN_180584 [Dreissena polymorpha]|uniref:LRRNT domain-containing protein n=1 Tax=Dreissena polymorpha TaxID=45954 RepID=A0A9D4ILS2_DREPO|nr:hypothetical protein DPMN_180584 [Dreissena polymorpha]